MSRPLSESGILSSCSWGFRSARRERGRRLPPILSAPPAVSTIAPIYFVRHRRARRYLLRVEFDGRVRVTIPRGGSRREADAFARRHVDWVLRQRAVLSRGRFSVDDRRRLRVQAHTDLPKRLRELADLHGLSVTRISIRNQRTRWGSCGRDGHVCLNWRLVAMPHWVRGLRDDSRADAPQAARSLASVLAAGCSGLPQVSRSSPVAARHAWTGALAPNLVCQSCFTSANCLPSLPAVQEDEGACMSVSRRQAVAVLAAAGVLGPLSLWLTSRDTGTVGDDGAFPVQKTDAEWRAALTSDRYRILRGRGTERAFSSPLNTEKRSGIFVCAACGQKLFLSDYQVRERNGLAELLASPRRCRGYTRIDRSWLMVRTEVHCARCGSHLGHVFADGPEPTGLRYCINGLALNFVTGSGVI